MTQRQLVIVTGANRGIGNAIVKRILSRPDQSFTLFATSRTGENLQLDSAAENRHEIFYPPLDIASESSIHQFRDLVLKHGRQVAALINNAGVNLDANHSFETAKRTLDVNYRGTRNMCMAFLPHLSDSGGRIVNLSSVASSLRPYGEAIQTRFRTAKTMEELDRLAEEYESSVSSRTESPQGFGTPIRSYALSKVLVRALTTILAHHHPSHQINCCCPGWIATSMGNAIASKGRSAPKSAEEGSVIPVRLALDEDLEGVTGAYWANGSVRGRGRGEVQISW